jgi:hypothetical protein
MSYPLVADDRAASIHVDHGDALEQSAHARSVHQRTRFMFLGLVVNRLTPHSLICLATTTLAVSLLTVVEAANLFADMQAAIFTSVANQMNHLGVFFTIRFLSQRVNHLHDHGEHSLSKDSRHMTDRTAFRAMTELRIPSAREWATDTWSDG